MPVSDGDLRKWLALVAGFCNPAFPADALMALDRLRPGLGDWDAAYFTRDSAVHVAEADRYGPVPDLRTVAKTLRAYRAQIGFARPALPPPQAADPEDDGWTTETRRAAVTELRALLATLARDDRPARAPMAPVPITAPLLAELRARAGY